MQIDWLFILFVFALGACIGSFLNVVVWRLPRGESLISPPSHCPRCNTPLAWYDNIPIFGWIMLRGRCRYCHEPISPRYPIIEAVTGLLFAFYYFMFFVAQVGPCAPQVALQSFTGQPIHPLLSIDQNWPIYALYMVTIAGLLACSLIDAELFIIPIEIPWLLALVGIIVHSLADQPSLAGSVNASALSGALAAGGSIGLILSIIGWRLGWIPTSFAQGEPELEVEQADKRQSHHPLPLTDDPAATAHEHSHRSTTSVDHNHSAADEREYSPSQVRQEISKELVFLLPPVILAALFAILIQAVPSIQTTWDQWMQHNWLSGLLGALFGAMIGALVVWLTRIFGTLAFGRVAMGLGDVHLMFGVGAIVGAGGATVAFFIAPFFGLALAIYMLFTGKRRELPYGPYLSLGTAAVMLYYCPIADYLRPGLEALGQILTGQG